MAELGRSETKLYPLSDFEKVLLEEEGLHKSYRTLYRWATQGWPNGKRLACVSVAGVLHTSLKAYRELIGGGLVTV